MRRLRALLSPAYIALAAILAVGLGVRLLHNTYGLPYVYNVDEGSHFTNRAVGMFGGSADPGYFQNPSAFTYLEHLALRFQYGPGASDPVRELRPADQAVRARPHQAIYRTGRTLAAVLCLLGVIAVFWVGRRLWGTFEGLAAAGVLSFAFLPVAYSRIARDGRRHPAAGVVRAVRGDPGVRGRLPKSLAARRGRWRASPSASSTPPGSCCCRCSLQGWRACASDRSAIRDGLLALVAAIGVFFVTNPYVFIDLSSAWHQLHGEAELAGKFKKLGQEQYSGPGYYFQSLTWGLGWAPRRGDAGRLGGRGAARRLPRRAPDRLPGGAVHLPEPAGALRSAAGCCRRTRRSRCWRAWRSLIARRGCDGRRGSASPVALGGLLLVWRSIYADVRTVRCSATPTPGGGARLARGAHPSGVRTSSSRPSRRATTAVADQRSRQAFIRSFIRTSPTRTRTTAHAEPRDRVDQYRRAGFCP